MVEFRSGVAYLAEQHPGVPVIPVFMHGFGIAMPRGAALPVPGAADIHVGAPLEFKSTRKAFMASLRRAFDDLRAQSSVRRRAGLDEGARSCRP
jgi:1-acyl-sn-glycerol-3-phosphate acyltransferase